MKSKILCKVEFRDFQTLKTETIIGKINPAQLLSEENQWITVSNRVHQNRCWEKLETAIHKDDIKKIWFYEKNSYLDPDFFRYNTNNMNKGTIA